MAGVRNGSSKCRFAGTLLSCGGFFLGGHGCVWRARYVTLSIEDGYKYRRRSPGLEKNSEDDAQINFGAPMAHISHPRLRQE